MLIYKLPSTNKNTASTNKNTDSTPTSQNFSNIVSLSKLPFLKPQRCINMTIEQYKNKEHINNKMCYIEIDTSLYDIEKNIIKELEIIRSKIQVPFIVNNKARIPLPIYVSIAKIISKDNEYILNNSLDIVNKNPTTFLEKYTFKGMIKIIIYVPNLMNNKGVYYNYYPSLDAYTNQNKWMEYMTSENSYFLKVIDYHRKNPPNDKNKNDNLFKKSLKNICNDFGCVSGNIGEDIKHITGKYGNSLYSPSKCLQFKEYSEKDFMKLKKTEFDKIYSKEGIGKFQENLKKILDKEKEDDKKDEKDKKDEEPEEPEDPEDVEFNLLRSYASTLDIIGEKKKKSYNNNIMNDINHRADSGFIGIQEITFRMFKLDPTYSKFTDFFHFMPWGDKLLNNEYVLNSGNTFSFEDSKYLSKNNIMTQYIKFKSINDKFYMNFNPNGVLAIYNNDDTQNKLVPFTSKNILLNTTNNRIEYNSITGLNFLGNYIKKELGKSEETLFINYITENRTPPYSLILDTDENSIGKFKIYDLGFNIIFNS